MSDNRATALAALGVGAALGYIIARAQLAQAQNELEERLQQLQQRPASERTLSRRSSKHRITSSDSDDDLPEATSLQRRVFVLFSGKRAAGKDYVAKRVKAALWSRGIGCVRVSMGDESKRLYADEAGVDFYRLMTDRDFKEAHREGITRLFRERIAQDPEYFHETALRRSDATPAPVVLITDARFKFDIEFFSRHHDVITVRINASDATRLKRGWVPSETKDRDDTETALDNYKQFDLVLDSSDSDDAMLNSWITTILMPLVKAKLRLLAPEGEEFVDNTE